MDGGMKYSTALNHWATHFKSEKRGSVADWCKVTLGSIPVNEI